MTYKIQGIKNETFKIAEVQNLNHAEALQKLLESQNFDGSLYHMERITEGTRKKSYTVVCYKAANHDTFVPMA